MKSIMTRKEFESLKAGDLLVWRGSYLRTVIEPPIRNGGHAGCVTLSIRRRSWTNRATTVYSYHDLKWLAFPANRKTRGLIMPSELRVLKELGFNLAKELKREVSEEIQRKQRMGRQLCKHAPKLIKMAGLEINC